MPALDPNANRSATVNVRAHTRAAPKAKKPPRLKQSVRAAQDQQAAAATARRVRIRSTAERQQATAAASARTARSAVAAVNPDQMDRMRPPAQKARDQAVATQSIKRAQVKVGLRRATASREAAQAPVLKVLSQLTRPLHAVANTELQAIRDVKHNKSPFSSVGGVPVPSASLRHAAVRGAENKDKTTTSDILHEAGWRPKGGLGKAALAATAFTGDVVGDPTTYLTGGAGTVAERTAVQAGKAAEKKALKSGLTADQAAAFRARAAKAAAKTGDQAKGAVVKVGGHEVPGVRKATATVAKPVRAAARKATPNRLRTGARNVGADVNPNVAPAGVSKATSDAAIRATRTGRAKVTQGERTAANVGHGIKKKIGPKNYAAVVDAIEQGPKGIAKLPPELRDHAVTLRSQSKHQLKIQRRSGQKIGEVGKTGPVKGYVHRQLTPEAVAADEKAAATAHAATGRAGKAASSKTRKVKAPMAALRVSDPGRYREDLHALTAERAAQGTTSTARADMNRSIADLGTPVKRGQPIVLKPGEAVYHVKADKLREVTDKAERDRASSTLRLNKKGTKIKGATPKAVGAGRYVVLSREVVKRAEEGISPKLGGSDKGIVRALDKTTVGFKRLALATVGFHVRNAVGDTSQAYVNQPARTLAPNLIRARRVTKALGREEVAQRSLARPGAAAKAAKDISKRPIKRTVMQAKRLREGRDLGRADYPELARNLKGVKGKPGSITKTRQDLSGGKHVTAYHYFDKNGDAVGWASLHSDGGRAVYVDPAYRRQGIATKLYRAGERDGYDIKNARGGNMQTELGDVLNRSMNRPAASGKTLKTAKYGHVSYEDVAHNLAQVGAARSGYTARELRDLSESGGRPKPGRGLGNTKGGRGIKRALLNREDIPRLATAIHALQHGATYEEAAAKVAEVHFDYGHLTQFERDIARRVMPFYTWSARNIPFTAKHVVTNPGKYAAFQKLRENAAKMSDPGQTDDQTKQLYKALELAGVKMPGGWEKYLSQYEQRNAGVPISWHGHKFTVSMGLPLQDLNELPGAAGKGQAGEWLNKAVSMANPVIKDPLEIGFNYSTFFRDKIESDTSPLVSAPTFVGGLPANVKKRLGVVQGVDNRSGKIIWKWPGKVDYAAHATPGAVNYALQFLTPGADRRGKTLGGKALAFSGVKSVPVDARTNAINLGYQRIADLNKRQAALRQTINPANKLPITAANPTLEFARNAMQIRLLEQLVYYGKAQRGDAKLPAVGGPPKQSVSSGTGTLG